MENTQRVLKSFALMFQNILKSRNTYVSKGMSNGKEHFIRE